MTISATPLSDCITRFLEQSTPENYEQFLRVFLGSQLGVILKDIPGSHSGQYVAGKNARTAAVGITPDGKRMLLACADRAIFVQRFQQPFNEEMGAVALLKTVLANPQCEGIMINSAVSEHSIGIPRHQIQDLLDSAGTAG
jgi:hypothetical protein